jgi:hypothetical protein
MKRQNKCYDPKSEVPREVHLGLWELWKHRNAVVFDGVTPEVAKAMCRVAQEGRAWWNAGLIKGSVEEFLGRLSMWSSRE